MKKQTVIRVGEKNNFNQSKEEFLELRKYENKGKIFVNSNSFNPVVGLYPSIITINPYMKHVDITGDLNNIKAVRIKVWKLQDAKELQKSLNFCMENNLNILLTYMRFRSKKTVKKYVGSDYREFYSWDHNYFRPKNKKQIYNPIADYLSHYGKFALLNECDASGNGCPDCMNCTKLTFGITSDVTIKALNLSISGINDINGRKGLCPYSCPDCFAKIVCYGKRPQCDKLITNAKISGKLTK